MPASGAVTPPRCHTHALGHPGGAARAAEPSRRLLPLADHDRRPDPARAGARQVQAERGPLSTGAFSPVAVTGITVISPAPSGSPSAAANAVADVGSTSTPCAASRAYARQRSCSPTETIAPPLTRTAAMISAPRGGLAILMPSAAVSPRSTATGAPSPRSKARAKGAQAEDCTP